MPPLNCDEDDDDGGGDDDDNNDAANDNCDAPCPALCDAPPPDAAASRRLAFRSTPLRLRLLRLCCCC